MRILLAPHGTRGDVQPMIALALGLRPRGHEVRFVGPSNLAGWIESFGFACEPDGIDVEAAMRTADLASVRWIVRYLRSELIPALFAAVARAADDVDLIIGSGVQAASASVAEKRGIAALTALFCPCAIPTPGTPPPTVREHRLPRWVNALLWRFGLPAADLALREAINTERAKLGLPPAPSPMKLLTADGVIIAADRAIAALDPAHPAGVVQTDAWLLRDQSPLDEALRRFLESGPPPVYVGFGSMIARDTTRLADDVLTAIRRSGRRAIVAGGWAALGAHVEPSAEIFPIASAPHQALFPRVAAVIHHGGAGTTAAAARAGVPQIVLPHILDQYYWGHRVEALGIGPRALPVNRVTADALASRVEAAVTSDAVRARSRDVAARLANADGVPDAIAIVERRVRCPA